MPALMGRARRKETATEAYCGAGWPQAAAAATSAVVFGCRLHPEAAR